MPQETNLNVAPYFDDFDTASNYYKVLFKPGYPVQARELNNLQSILQNQVEDVGNHLFKEGAKVIPGQLSYLSNFHCIQIEPEFLGIPVSLYLDKLVGKRLTGESSGVTAQVVKYLTDKESDNGNWTIYVDYFESATTDLSTQTFFDNEVLLTEEAITFSTTFIAAGEGFAKTLNTNAAETGSAFALSNGVYFLRGYFVDVHDQILILDQYSNRPSYRIGLNVSEELISSDIDPTLNDNAQGFNNFTAPGADRFQIKATLTKKEVDDFNDQNFVQLAEVRNGILREINDKVDYNILGNELARRTFDESGHYYIREFVTVVRESLNNGYGNRGIYNSNQTTWNGNTPSDDKCVYKIGPGKAYIRGYEVDVRGPTFLDVTKPRTTRAIENQAVNFGFGPTFVVNRSYGTASIGFNTTNTLSLRDERVGDDQKTAPGKEIGVARVWDYNLESGSYNSSADLNEWDLSLFDVQVYTDFTVNEAVTLTTPTFVQGQSSGAQAYLRNSVSAGTAFTCYDVKGEFYIGEQLKFNGVSSNARTTTDLTNYEISDIKSVYGIVGTAKTFTADMIQSLKTEVGIVTITAASGVSTVTTPTQTWPGIVTTGNIVRYSIPNNTVPSLARVESVATNSITISGVTTITGFCEGALPTTPVEAVDFQIVETKIQKNSGGSNIASNDTLYSIFPKKNIESVDIEGGDLTIRRSFDTTITDGSTSTLTASSNEVFLPYDEERYTLVRSDGSTESLSADKFTFGTGSTQVTIDGLSGTDDGATLLVATLRKSKVTSKTKINSVVGTTLIDKSSEAGSGIGGTTLNDGLTYAANYPFGTRVQDPVICLNIPDIVTIFGIFESKDTSDPVTPSMTTASMDGATGTTNDLILGEEVLGTISGAKAKYISKKSDSAINMIYKNNTVFENGEVITFTESGVSALATNIDFGSTNVTADYNFSNGQKSTIYDYARIIRKVNSTTSTKKLKVYYLNAYYESSDTGDITICNSYDNFNYSSQISAINGVRNTDIIDARPRVSTYTVSAGARSPFEFDGRVFDGGQHSSKNILASDESISLGYTYYLPRIDRVYLDKDGIFSVKEGAPDDNPTLPDEVSGALNVANISLPPYLFHASQARISFIDHKRYQMSDISKLEQRIKNLEYYTSLNQLETTTMNLFVADANGLNRFKSGVYVDNFSSTKPQDESVGFRNAIDRTKRVLRPCHYTTSFNLEVGNTTMSGIGTTTAAGQDTRYADLLGTNIKRSSQMVTLDYSETEWLTQPFATRSESVTPFLVKFWEGSLFFEPTVDVWIDVNRMELRDVLMEGSFQGVAEAMRAEITTHADGSRSGISPVIWKAWETTGVDVSFSLDSSQTQSSSTSMRQGGFQDAFGIADLEGADGNWWSAHSHQITAGQLPEAFNVAEETTTTNTTITGTVGVDLQQQREGTQTTVTEQIDTESLGDRIVSRNIIHFMRARNVEFTARRMKPYTRVYPFFDNVDVDKFCMSKLIEIEMVSGTFQVGEGVGGIMPSVETSQQIDEATKPAIVFRVATTNHKYGPYNDPVDRFDRNPYNREVRIPATYSETSTILNCDTFSLANEDQPEFQGYVATGMILRGANSGAHAIVKDVRLVTDRLGTLIGSYRIPSSADPSNPIFETGRSRLRLTSSPIDSKVEGTVTTAAEEIFYSQGDIDNTQEVTLSLRNARVEHNDNFRQTRTIGDSATASTTFETGSSSRLTGVYTDPLAQTFMVDDPTGIYLTSLDLYFHEKDTQGIPVTVQIREVQLGTPTQKILAYSEVEMDPDNVNISTNASAVTNFKFESPVYLNGQREYALVVLSNSTEYRVWISRLGESDIQTLAREEGQVLVSTQNLLGSLFKSQNASVWTPSQYEDLTFKLNRAEFVKDGSVQFFNPKLPEDMEAIPMNGITIDPYKIRVGLGTTVVDSGLAEGNTVSQTGTLATGTYVGAAGSATGTLTVTNAGVGYTPSSAYYVFSGVALTSVTGSGLNATAEIAINNGVAIAATISAAGGGKGYAVGDVLSPIEIGNKSLGSGMKLSVGELYGTNELILTNCQGEFGTSATQYLNYTNSSGVTTTLNYSVGGQVVPTSPIVTDTDGLHMKIFQRNHGMHATTNVVTLKDLQTTLEPTTLTEAYSNSATGTITIGSTSNFAEFEGVGVAATNPGYLKISSEIIKYTGFSGATLTGITRGIDDSPTESHGATDLVYKYELGGISLRRINKSHNFNEVTKTDPLTLDSYHVKLDVSDTDYGINRSSTGNFAELKFNAKTMAGGSKSKGTYNVPFEMIIPNFNSMTPTGTTINASVRTTSGQSISGTEAAFVDKGFQGIAFGQENYFDSPRLVASRINETTLLTDLPGNKSLTMNLNLVSEDSRITPSVDLDQVALVFVSQRVNAPVANYATNMKVNTTTDDPNRFFYVTKNIVLENPATSIQVFLDAYVSTYNDVRVFYALNQDTTVDQVSFVPFPGFDNLDPDREGVVISNSANDGQSDTKVTKVDLFTATPTLNMFKEYKFTADNIPPFSSYRIKIIGTSTNQAIVPQFKNLRTIALA